MEDMNRRIKEGERRFSIPLYSTGLDEKKPTSSLQRLQRVMQG